MIAATFDYVRPAELRGALRILAEREGKAKLTPLQPIVDDIVLGDPVCGMAVDRARARHLAEEGGIVYAFCSIGCRTRFTKDPAAYHASPGSHTMETS